MRKEITIGSIGRIVTGKTPPKTNPNYFGDYALWIKPTDISESSKYTKKTEEGFSKLAADEYQSCLIPKGAICVPCIGTIGTKMTIAHCDCYTNQSINSIVCNEHYDHEYVYYLIKHFLPGLKAYNLGTASGREYVSKTSFEAIEIKAEQDIEIQRKQSAVLCAYDNLIDNLQKQITLLEEAVQRLYTEWFVDLRFPGYEKVKVVDGVPEGWKLTYLGEIACFHRGQVISQKNIHNGIIPVVAGGLEPAYYCDKSNTENRVITISGSGANAGYTRLYYERIWASDCSFIDSTRTNYLCFTYSFLKANKVTINNLQRGAAQPHVYAKDINDMELLLPEDNVLKSFENNVVPFFDLIAKLVQQIKILTEARDRLLPKLMNGEINIR